MSDPVSNGARRITPANDHEALRAIDRAAAALADDSVKRVLIVDDEETIRLALGRFLRNRGYEVDLAPSGQHAIELLNERKYAVMLCDLRMPGMSGLEILPQALAREPDLGVIMLTAVNDAGTATEALSSGAFDYLTKPVELADLQNALERALSRRTRGMERRAVDRLIREEVAIRTAELEQEKEALRDMTVNIAETLINAMEAKDVYLRGHSHRVADLSAAIARQLGISDPIIDSIHLAGRLHDIGKIGIREAVLNKAGPLTAEEFEHVKDHVRIGIEILSPLRHLGSSLRFIHDHHEHWDGSGYPRGLSGEEISLGGRILTAADSFDALTSQRAYRDPMTARASLDYLRTQSGRLLEPRMYGALVEVVNTGFPGHAPLE